MDNNDIFSGIPTLGDEAGLENYLNNSALDNLGLGNDTTPAALQVQPGEATPTPAPAPAAPATPAAPQYSAEQVAQIVARNQQLEAAQAQAQMQQQQQPRSPYTPYQATLIKQLIDKGVPMERIQAALNGQSSAYNAQTAIDRRVANLEGYLQQQQYEAAQNEFITRMTNFGDKFGLSEDDLVTFGNKAMEMGINLINVSNVEAVFRAVYPEQYAIRSQRIAGSASPQIYGGSVIPEPARASATKLEDAYVDQFLRNSMPNQYGMYAKK